MGTISKKKMWLTVILPFALGYIIAGALRLINAILVKPLTDELHFVPAEIGLITSMFVLTFALVQLPMGVMLDIWGARKTQTLLFLIGAVGIVMFGMSSTVTMLSISRGLIGIGMAGGALAAFKAIAKRTEKENIPFYNSLILAAGGTGALLATTPSHLIADALGWRVLCYGFGGATVIVALIIFFVCEDLPKSERTTIRFHDRLIGIKKVYTDRFFWQVAPLLALSLGGFVAMQGLWLGPWLHDVCGFEPLDTANYLLSVALGMVAGVLSGGLFAYLSRVTKLSLANIVALGVAIHIATQIIIITNVWPGNYVLWFVYGYFAQIVLVSFAIYSQYFGADLSGRALTAANVLVFLFAFVYQSGFGFILRFLAGSDTLHPPVFAYQSAFSLLVGLQAIALVWFFIQEWRGKKREDKVTA